MSWPPKHHDVTQAIDDKISMGVALSHREKVIHAVVLARCYESSMRSKWMNEDHLKDRLIAPKRLEQLKSSVDMLNRLLDDVVALEETTNV